MFSLICLWSKQRPLQMPFSCKENKTSKRCLRTSLMWAFNIALILLWVEILAERVLLLCCCCLFVFFKQYLNISSVKCFDLQMEILHKLEQGEGKIKTVKKQMNKTTQANFSSSQFFQGKVPKHHCPISVITLRQRSNYSVTFTINACLQCCAQWLVFIVHTGY